MINLDQIDEWIKESEQRPTSAPLIIRYIAGRLRDLSERNEELLAENIALRTGRKVDEYESRIANLEYQLDLLKRQVGGDIDLSIPIKAIDTISALIYNVKGRVLRIELPLPSLESGMDCARIEGLESGGPARVLFTSLTEELLFVFDSGRTVAIPVTDIPALSLENSAGKLDWKKAYLVEPRGGEELATIAPVARMSLFDYCIQTSRRGCVKKMMRTSFESHVSKNYVGAGVKNKPDRTCDLILSSKEDVLVLATREGFLWSGDTAELPYTTEEVLKLSATDYIAASFVVGTKPSLLVVTGGGKVIHRESGWLEKANSYKSRGQAIFSPSRREAGVRVVGAAIVDAADWGAVLTSDGKLRIFRVGELISAGTLAGDMITPIDQETWIKDFVTFSLPGENKA